MPVIVCKDQASHSQRRCRGGDRREHSNRRQLMSKGLLDEVVAQQERGISQVLGLTCGIEECRWRANVFSNHTKAEWSSLSHAFSCLVQLSPTPQGRTDLDCVFPF